MSPARFISTAATILIALGGSTSLWGQANLQAPKADGLNPVHQGQIPDEARPKWRWRATVGHGYASAAVRGQTVFAGFHRGGREGVTAFDLTSGEQLWERTWPESFEGGGYGPGPNAPLAFVGRNLLVTGVQLKVHLLDPVGGAVLWQRDLVEEEGATIPGHGYAASAFVHQREPQVKLRATSLLYGLGGKRSGPIISLNAETGATEWKKGTLKIAYATPGRFTPIEPNTLSRAQAVFYTERGTTGIDPETGDELWRLPHPETPTWNAALSPFQTGPDTLFTATRSDAHNGSRAIRVRRTSNGFVAEESWFNQNLSVEPTDHAVFQQADSKSPAIVYATAGGGRSPALRSIDAATGRVLSEQEGVGYASLLRTGDRLLGLTERGLLIAWSAQKGLQPEPGRLSELWRFDTQSKRSWSRPLLVGDQVIIRSRTRVGVLDLDPP